MSRGGRKSSVGEIYVSLPQREQAKRAAKHSEKERDRVREKARRERVREIKRDGGGGREIPKTFTFYPSAPVELKRKRSIILLSLHRENVQRGVFYSG